MKTFIYIKYLVPAIIAVIVLFFLPACDDDEPEELAIIEHFEWYAAGSDVAPLFRAFPLLTDSIYLRIRTNIPSYVFNPDSILYRMYLEMYDENKNLQKTITGRDQPDWGARFETEVAENEDVIFFYTTNAEENGTQVTLEGIYQEYPETDPPVMKIEFVYKNIPGWPKPPNAHDGFGSTENGAYGDNNIHRFRKIIIQEDDDDV